MYNWRRHVHDIISSLEEENYDPLELPPERKTITGKISKEETIKFTNHPPQAPGRQRLGDVIHKRLGVTREASKAKSLREAFELFITPDMIEELVNRTNSRIKKTLGNLSQYIHK